MKILCNILIGLFSLVFWVNGQQLPIEIVRPGENGTPDETIGMFVPDAKGSFWIISENKIFNYNGYSSKQIKINLKGAIVHDFVRKNDSTYYV